MDFYSSYNSSRKRILFALLILGLFFLVFLLYWGFSTFNSKSNKKSSPVGPRNEPTLSEILHRREELSENFLLEWKVYFPAKTIEFTATVKTKGYVGFGISYTGDMTGSDVIFGGVYSNKTTYFSDRHATGKYEPLIDEKQDWRLNSAYENTTHTILKFSRLLDTCDNDDIPINDDTLKIIWSYGTTDEIIYHGHGHSRGVLAVNFLDPEIENPNLSPYKVWRVTKAETLPSADTTYLCTFFEGPTLSKKHHIVGFDMFFKTSESKKHTHHADLYKCKAPKGQNPREFFSQYLGKGFDCYFSQEYFPIEYCQMFEFQWSIGGKITMLPEEIGVPFGESRDEFYMTEIHYDNPQEIEGLEVDSGMDFYYTDNLRPIDAGFIQVGSMTSKLYSLTVPPNAENFIFSTHCPSDCTTLLPQDGINVFIYLLHSHLSSREQRLRHFRNGTELPWIANDEHYDFNYQNNRQLRKYVKILPGDHLTLECTYDTNWKLGSMVTGGRSPREEMCQTFLMYYPRTESINQCGSYFPQQLMLNYMGINNVTAEKGEIDPRVISPENLRGKKYSEVVESLNWTPEKRFEFQNMFRNTDHQSYCYPFHIEDEIGFPFVTTNYPEIEEEFKPANPCQE